MQLGDFGYWEHEQAGADFLDLLGGQAADTGIPFYWLHGNHDKHSLAMKYYSDNVTMDGFLWCRPGVNYIPQGKVWDWAGVRMRAFGGAYSVDKAWRLELEAQRRRKAETVNDYFGRAGKSLVPTDFSGTLWFPEEEMTDADMDRLLADYSGSVDVVFSHDKPRGSDPGWNRKDLPECWPNQDRLQRALVTHKPELWLHGHLHHAYQSMVRCGDDDRFTCVVGLGPDSDAAPSHWKRTDSWGVLDFGDGRELTYTSGSEEGMAA